MKRRATHTYPKTTRVSPPPPGGMLPSRAGGLLKTDMSLQIGVTETTRPIYAFAIMFPVLHVE